MTIKDNILSLIKNTFRNNHIPYGIYLYIVSISVMDNNIPQYLDISIRELSSITKVEYSKLRRILNKMSDAGIISQTSAGNITRITFN